MRPGAADSTRLPAARDREDRHRRRAPLSTIMDADRVLFLGLGGRVLEYGTVDELLSREGPFRDLWRSQSWTPPSGRGPSDEASIRLSDEASIRMPDYKP